PPINTRRILLTALNFVIIQTHARIGDSIVRRIKQVVELVGFEPETNELITNTVYEWDPATDSFLYKGHSFLFDEIMEMKNMTHEEMEAEFQRRVDIINYMRERDIVDFREIAKIVISYYQYPDEAAKKIRDEMGWVREPVQARYKENQDLEDNLLRAHIKLRPEEYLAIAWLNTTIAAVSAVAVAFFLALFLFVLRASISLVVVGFALIAIVPGLLAYAVYF